MLIWIQKILAHRLWEKIINVVKLLRRFYTAPSGAQSPIFKKKFFNNFLKYLNTVKEIEITYGIIVFNK